MHISEHLNDLYEQRQRLCEQLDAPREAPQGVRGTLSYTAEVADMTIRLVRAQRELQWTEKQILALLSNPRLGDE